jgi:hypothetical protein
MLTEMIADAKPKEYYLFFAVDVDQFTEEINTFFKKHNLRLAEKKVNSKGIARAGTKREWLPSITEIRYTNLPIPGGATIFNDTVCFYDWGEKPIGYMIKSKQIAERFRKLFYEIWEREGKS